MKKVTGVLFTAAVALVAVPSLALADLPATTTTASSHGVSDISNTLYDGGTGIFLSGLNAAFAVWPAWLAVLVPVSIGVMAIAWLMKKGRLGA